MECSKFARLCLCNFRSLTILILVTITAGTVVAAPQAPSNVSALLYSNTSAELFWTPSDGQRVRVERNGELLGVYDARSLFQSGLNPSQQYRYVLQSVNSNGERSPSWQVDIAPGNHPLSNNRINAFQGNAPVVVTDTSSNNQAEPQIQAQPPQAPSNVSALLYSNTSAELFWTPSDGQRVRVERNGQLLGVYDARSLFQPGLDPSQQYRYELQSVNSDGEASLSWLIDIAPGGFSLPIKRIIAQLGSAPDTSIALNDAPSTIEPESTPEPEPQPEPQQPQAVAQVISPNPNPASGCEVRTLSDLSRCISNNDSTVTVLNDLSCSGGNCCPSGRALLSLQSKRNLIIDGNGHQLLRSSGQRNCSLLDINSASNITLRNWQLDDDINVAGCQVADGCPRTLHIRQSSNIQLDNMHISHGKSYAIYVNAVNRFGFRNSSLTNSGVLGLYIGHSSTPSNGVVIENSIFRDNQTSALALLGVTGSKQGENRVTNNLFIRNHRRGQWLVEPRYGSGYTGGGQVYMAQAKYVDFDNNQILDGYCENCAVQRRTRSGASGLEFGLPGKASVSHVRVRNNIISNHDAFGISHNQNSNLSGNVQLANNTLVNNTVGDYTRGSSKTGMTVSDTEVFDSYENTGGVQTGTYCSSGATAQRQCGVTSRHGSCVMRLSLAGNDCDGSAASVISDWNSVAELRRVFLNGWINRVGGGQADGQWCLEFANSSRDVINTQCKALNEADQSRVQAFVGSPSLDAVSPKNSRYVRYRVTLNGARSTLDVDDVKLSID
ncbi:MAG: right-handed parallel beta-helix repeat-containing protein [Granulosicoccaceae bacterium]